MINKSIFHACRIPKQKISSWTFIRSQNGANLGFGMPKFFLIYLIGIFGEMLVQFLLEVVVTFFRDFQFWT